MPISFAKDPREVARALAESGALTAKQYDAWRLSRVSGLSLRTIASASDCSVSTVRDRLRAADLKIFIKGRAIP